MKAAPTTTSDQKERLKKRAGHLLSESTFLSGLAPPSDLQKRETYRDGPV